MWIMEMTSANNKF